MTMMMLMMMMMTTTMMMTAMIMMMMTTTMMMMMMMHVNAGPYTSAVYTSAKLIYSACIHTYMHIHKLICNTYVQFIYSNIYIAPLQGNYSKELPTPVQTKR